MSRKCRYIVSLMLMTIIVLIIGYCIWNNNKGLKFSIPSGFYSEEQKLIISGPKGAIIYYTTDGSIPDRESENTIRYEGEIFLKDATESPNVYSMIAETSIGNMPEKLEEINKLRMEKNLAEVDIETACYKLPQYSIDKCNVINAVYYNILGEKSDVYTGIYFIGFDEKHGYDNLCVISLNTDPKNLFDYEKGIYVLGKRYDDFVKDGKDTSEYWHTWQGNFDYHGAQAEREAVMCFFDEQHNLCFKKNIGIRIQGNSSRKYNPKSLNLYSRRAYDGETSFPDIFGTGYKAESLNLFMGSQDSDLKLRDAVLNNLTVDYTSVGLRHYIPCAMFLDGEYWGLYFLTEKFDEAFLQEYKGIRKEDAVIVKFVKLECGNDSDLDNYNEMRSFLSTADLSIDENYILASEMIDMKNAADYYAIMTFSARFNDWPSSNYEMWKSRRGGQQQYNDGKWRWMVFDMNSGSFTSALISDWTITRIRGEDEIFNNLCSNNEFKYLFIKEYLTLMDTCLSYEKANSLITKYEKLLDEPMRINNMRFYSSINQITPGYYGYEKDGLTFVDKCNSLRTFWRERKQYIYEDLCRNFGETLVNELSEEIKKGADSI